MNSRSFCLYVPGAGHHVSPYSLCNLALALRSLGLSPSFLLLCGCSLPALAAEGQLPLLCCCYRCQPHSSVSPLQLGLPATLQLTPLLLHCLLLFRVASAACCTRNGKGESKSKERNREAFHRIRCSLREGRQHRRWRCLQSSHQ